MSQRVYINSFKTTLSSDIGQNDTVIPVVSTSAVTAMYPSLSNGQYFLVTIDNGSNFEIIECHGVSGNSLTDCVRGREGTSKTAFSQGTRIEARVTAGTLSAFARLQDRLGDLASIDELPAASSADGNSYLISATDEAGNAVVATKRGNLWSFVNFPVTVKTYTLVSTGGTTGVDIGSTSFVLSTQMVTDGAYVIQFTNGTNAGLCRRITSRTSSTVSWATELPSTPAVGDTCQIYQSVTATLASTTSAQDENIALAMIFGE